MAAVGEDRRRGRTGLLRVGGLFALLCGGWAIVSVCGQYGAMSVVDWWTVVGTVLGGFGLAVGAFGVLVSLVGIAIAWFIAVRQGKQSDDLREVVELTRTAMEDLQEIAIATAGSVRELAEVRAEKLERIIEEEEIADPTPSVVGDPDDPLNADELLMYLHRSGADLEGHEVRWRRKRRSDGEARGNLGWFAESPKGERWFVRKGRGEPTVRRAVPRDLLAKWQAVTGLDPTAIRLDYRVGGGNASWYVETYDGDTWRLSRGGRGKSEPTVSFVTAY